MLKDLFEIILFEFFSFVNFYDIDSVFVFLKTNGVREVILLEHLLRGEYESG